MNLILLHFQVTIILDQSTCFWVYFVKVRALQLVFLKTWVLILVTFALRQEFHPDTIHLFYFIFNLIFYKLSEQVIRMVGESTEAVGAGVGGGSSGNKMPTLEEYGTNLTKLAEEVLLKYISGDL